MNTPTTDNTTAPNTESLPLSRTRYMSTLTTTTITCVLGISIGYWYGLHHTHNEVQEEVRLNEAQYTYINPLLDYQAESTTLLRGDIKDLKAKLESSIKDAKEAGSIKDASLYYRDLNNGPWFSINDDLTYTPASLLKIPLMIAYYKLSENDPAVLQQKITYATEIDVPNHSITNKPSSIKVGTTYTIEELIELMITESDNVATALLQQHIDIKVAEKIFKDFAVPLPGFLDPQGDFIEAREYASFLRILYNSTYLSRDNSEKALALLARSTFTDGIKSGVPEGVTVSNKFGASLDKYNTKQLHDCGIVYDPKVNPYIICIMTTGTEYTAMANVIKDSTALIHNTLLSTEHRVPQ
jgi:beta-lactamase class A